jgi:polyphosphate kinase
MGELLAVEISQEASWLSFNRRVLEQVHRPDFPLLERLRFLAIWASNMDEFYTARVARAFAEGRASQQYLELMQQALSQTEEANRLYLEFLKSLSGLGIHILEPNQLTKAEKQYFGAYLAEEVAPLTDHIRPEMLPELNSQALYFAAGEGLLQHLIRLPESLPRLLEVPGREGAYVRLGALVRMRSDLFLSGGHKLPLYEFRLLRLAQLSRARADWDELPEALEARLDGGVSHLEIEEDFPDLWAQTIQVALGLRPYEIFRLSPPLDLRFVSTVVDQGPSKEKFPPLLPQKPKGFRDLWNYLQRDLVVYHPFEDYALVEELALQAAKDPKVEAMRATLYRIGSHNGIAEALMLAAKSGKDVAVLLEGRARFDELANLEWSLRFSGSGVRVLPLPNKKVHAKALYIKRGATAYAHLGTGNYNPTNGKLYTDLSLFTSNVQITNDVKVFFQALEERRSPLLSLLHTSSNVREALLEGIKGESHKKGHIIFKFNHLTDPKVLQALEQAIQQGAKVELIIRSTLTRLWKGEKATVKSLVGRYLEHARIAAFGNKGKWKVWASSADVMPRNLDSRYELFFPILDVRSRRKVLELLQSQLSDDRNSYLLLPEGQQVRWGGKHNGQTLD